MSGYNTNLAAEFYALSVLYCLGAERGEKVAHGVNRGIRGQGRISSGGTSENRSPFGHPVAPFACSFDSFAPAGACCVWERCPTATICRRYAAASWQPFTARE